MRLLVRGTLGVLFLLGTAGVGYAGCDPQGTDKAAVDAARAQVQTDCTCDHADPPTVNHGQYVSCAAGVANTRAGLDPSGPNFLPHNCKGAVKKCAARSTCGKGSTAVTCCTLKSDGVTIKCKTKKDSAHCPTDQGAVVGACASCCDACPAPGSGPTCP
jgi:hypothetical protein